MTGSTPFYRLTESDSSPAADWALTGDINTAATIFPHSLAAFKSSNNTLRIISADGKFKGSLLSAPPNSGDFADKLTNEI